MSLLPETFTWSGVQSFIDDFISNSVIQTGLYAMVALGVASVVIGVVKRFGR